MALSNKQLTKQFIKNRAGDGIITSDDITAASASFAANIEESDPNFVGAMGPILYHIDLMQEDVNEIRRYMTGSFTVPSRIGSAGASGDVGAGTEVFELHNTQTLQAGAVCYSGASSWDYANATSAGAASYGFMGVTTSTST